MVKVAYQLKCRTCQNIFRSEKRINPYCSNKCEKKYKTETVVSKILKSPKLGYHFELFKIKKSTLNKFIFLDNRRKLSKHQLGSLKKLIYSEKHFDSPIVINKVEDGFRVVDGNHRIETIKSIISRNPKFSIEVLLIIYRNLDEDAEIEAFRRWNVGKVQSTDDFIQSIAHKIPIIRWVKKDFPIPVSIYKTPKTLGIRLLCGSMIAAKANDDTGYGLKRDNFASDMERFEEEDYDYMKEWAKNFKDIFGLPSGGSRYYTSTFFTACMYITFENKNETLWKSFSEKVLNDAEVLEYSKFSGREGNRKMISILKDKLKIKARSLNV